ncbi:hypothetical protein KKD19_04235 [Patescibacteria group bacterium]|nr:hypothetical protein [Patescibacteria group bacterium]MBU4512416.1 hypothetical protein [Patescibacteria group bacterium]MCG2693266.1 hypothetical protein [Candidatus Parcubacteria bacterium]
MDSSSVIRELPMALFKSILPFAIVLLIDKPSTIAVRISNRDGCEYNEELISTFQDREIKWASSVAAALEIPIKIVDLSSDIENLPVEVGQFLSKESH